MADRFVGLDDMDRIFFGRQFLIPTDNFIIDEQYESGAQTCIFGVPRSSMWLGQRSLSHSARALPDRKSMQRVILHSSSVVGDRTFCPFEPSRLDQSKTIRRRRERLAEQELTNLTE